MVRTQWPRRGEDDADHRIELGPGVLPPPPHRRRADFRPFGRWVPWLVPVFVVANFAMFAVAMYINNCPAHSNKCVGTSLFGRFAFEPFEENYFLGPSLPTLEKMGGLDVKRVVNNHQAWRLITCIWLHGGVVHLLANMLGLLFIGIRLEQEFGFVRIGVLYVTAGFGGSVLSALVARSRYSVGASGALFGLLGAMLSELLTNWTIYSNKFAALLTLVLVIAINMAIGLLPHVDNAAHIGGFISGFLLGFVILVRPQFAWVKRKNAPVGYQTGSAKCKHNICQYILWIVSAFLLIVGFTAGLVMLFQGVDLDEYCSWCHYLSCIPTKRWNCEQPVKKCNVFQSGIHFNLTCVDSGRIHDLVIAIVSDAGINKQLNKLCVKLCS